MPTAKIGKSILTYSADNTTIPENDGFLVDADGILFFTPRGNVDYVDWSGSTASAAADLEVELPVLSGVHYPYDIAKVDITNSTTVSQIWVVLGQSQ